ncbi:hypothetical protein EVAR_71078_1 [Eumeta japonica]|uniref:Uncharacterized protein n=1 Tax=Eumeta variegata TaxID=151549 RepID=A0A4C2A9K4_EUMVA|nr:hypothetical protein EVAR_71078_1 [Eumeta japonica]
MEARAPYIRETSRLDIEDLTKLKRLISNRCRYKQKYKCIAYLHGRLGPATPAVGRSYVTCSGRAAARPHLMCSIAEFSPFARSRYAGSPRNLPELRDRISRCREM